MSTRPQAREVAPPSAWEGEAVRCVSPTDIRVHPTGPADEELLRRVRTGESAALEVLFERYSRLFMGIGLRILGDRGEAEELVQELFLYLFQKAALFDPSRGTANRWLVQVAYHRALDRRGYLQRRGFYVGTDLEPWTDTLVGETDLDREIAARLSRVQLEKAFAELLERQRETLELFYFEGLDLREISVKLGEPLPQIRHHYYRGLEKLRKSAFVQKMGKARS